MSVIGRDKFRIPSQESYLQIYAKKHWVTSSCQILSNEQEEFY